MWLIMNEPCFNIIYKTENNIIPEVEDNELLQFSLVFMGVLRRDIEKKQGYNFNKKRNEKQ